MGELEDCQCEPEVANEEEREHCSNLYGCGGGPGLLCVEVVGYDQNGGQ